MADYRKGMPNTGHGGIPKIPTEPGTYYDVSNGKGPPVTVRTEGEPATVGGEIVDHLYQHIANDPFASTPGLGTKGVNLGGVLSQLTAQGASCASIYAAQIGADGVRHTGTVIVERNRDGVFEPLSMPLGRNVTTPMISRDSDEDFKSATNGKGPADILPKGKPGTTVTGVTVEDPTACKAFKIDIKEKFKYMTSPGM
ncbi:MAG: hypothetical protein ABL897_06525 [Hyphomicrobium sp.]